MTPSADSLGDRGARRRLIADIDLMSIAEALDDHGGMTQWWYDPASGEVEPRFEDTLDEHEDDDPDERGLVAVWAAPSEEAYGVMVEFAEAVGDRRAASLLARALEGRGAFRRFRDTLYEFPELREHWSAYERACADIRAIRWLIDEDLVDEGDAREAIAARNTVADEVLAEAGHRGLEIDAAQITERWSDIANAVDAGRTVTVLRDGIPWAQIAPPE